ncbi:hypothetical protein D5S17_27115 [Pseudonocardiaceae bacterium YIM PH 21723]|nr:hypothetical protein D5S17_27115 [Pseudonocardiaceae bacterium YIM PH 21723]
MRIPGSEGVSLDSIVMTPKSGGPHPVLVLPASWSAPKYEYFVPSTKLARSGYVVVQYNPRGWYASTGRIDVGGPKDMADLSAVIDWALANTPADASKVGLAGISYGAGFSLLGAAHDKRVKAVAAMSGWTDLRGALEPNGTLSMQVALALEFLGHTVGRAGPELDQSLLEFAKGNVSGILDPIEPEKRSPATYIDRINAQGAPILLANAWSDSIFPPSQYTKDFYEKLTVPKRMEFQPGDHAMPEGGGLAGIPNETWDSVTRWMDHYLRGVDNGIDGENPVRLKPTFGPGAWRTFPSWSAAVPAGQKRYLGDVTKPPLDRTGFLDTEPQTGWKHTIVTGTETPAFAGIAVASNLGKPFGLQLPTNLALASRFNAGVWATEKFGEATQFTGPVKLHTTITPSAKTAQLVGYLYDTNALGISQLLSYKPITVRNLTPGAPVPIDLNFEPINQGFASGHRLTLVVDSMDLIYFPLNVPGSRITFSSPAEDPSYAVLPIG